MFYDFLNIDFITISEGYENQLEDPSNQQPDKQFKNSSINSSSNNNSNHNNHKSQIKNLKNQLSGRLKNKNEKMLESQTISLRM